MSYMYRFYITDFLLNTPEGTQGPVYRWSQKSAKFRMVVQAEIQEPGSHGYAALRNSRMDTAARFAPQAPGKRTCTPTRTQSCTEPYWRQRPETGVPKHPESDMVSTWQKCKITEAVGQRRHPAAFGHRPS